MSLPPPNQMQAYITTARRRQRQRQVDLDEQRACALVTARQAAQILKAEFGASRVAVFGSVLDSTNFHAGSDIDLAVWNLASGQYIKALAKLMTLSSFEIDLVPAESASSYIKAAIAQGLPL